MNKSTQGVTVVGYASPGLVGELSEAGWKDFGAGDGNFAPIGIGGYCLTKLADKECPIRYAVTVEDRTTGKKFSVTGYSYPTLMRAATEQEPVWGRNSLCDEELEEAPSRGKVPYVLTIQTA